MVCARIEVRLNTGKILHHSLLAANVRNLEARPGASEAFFPYEERRLMGQAVLPH
jgi:hypothetical protein